MSQNISTDSDLNVFGKKGWELVAVISNEGQSDALFLFFFKRELKEPPQDHYQVD